jgi:hypothetical protein
VAYGRSRSLEHQGLQGKVFKEIDLALRTYLGARGMKKGDLSKFIEDAVRWRIFNRTVQGIKSRNAAADPDELQVIIDGAVREARGTHVGSFGRGINGGEHQHGNHKLQQYLRQPSQACRSGADPEWLIHLEAIAAARRCGPNHAPRTSGRSQSLLASRIRFENQLVLHDSRAARRSTRRGNL